MTFTVHSPLREDFKLKEREAGRKERKKEGEKVKKKKKLVKNISMFFNLSSKLLVL